jgi:5-formyltetrahydrofolate cyclo-ligase
VNFVNGVKGDRDVTAITAEKKTMRDAAKSARAAAFAQHGASASVQLAQHGVAFLAGHAGATVAGFSAINDEIDPKPLMLLLAGLGHRLALPTMQGKGKPLVFRQWTPGDEMAPAVWGIAEPLATRAVVAPDVLLVPLLAFDARGYRLGYGGGFYDRSLEQLRAQKPITAVGVAYDEQRLDAVPHLDYDQPLDWVLTPSGRLKCLKD